MELQEVNINGNRNEQTEIYTDGSDQIVVTIYESRGNYRYSKIRYTGISRVEHSGYAETFEEAEEKLSDKMV